MFALGISSALCDVYLPQKISGDLITKCILRRDIDFDIVSKDLYAGYLGLNVKRLIGLMAVMRLKDVASADAVNVPIRYRDRPHIDIYEARSIAAQVSYGDGRKASYDERQNLRFPHPMYWVFGLEGGDGSIAGGSVYVDRLDGHVWSGDELDEYSHDYNNAFWVK